MKRFAQLVLILQFVSISVYTGYVALKYGTDLFNVFFGEMLSLTWTGQFHFDFWIVFCYNSEERRSWGWGSLEIRSRNVVTNRLTLLTSQKKQ